MKANRVRVCLGIIVLVVLGAGCGSRGMRSVSQPAIAPPGPDEAVVVFMRPLLVGGTYSTSVFDLRPDGDRFVGILLTQTRLAYRVPPGRTRFMLVATGGNDQFMDAELAGGKTYYAAVGYETVGNIAAYVLQPVPVNRESKEVKECLEHCAWVENTEKSEAWGRNHLRDLPKRKARYLPAWEARSPRPALGSADAR
jgi:hypothetical protein